MKIRHIIFLCAAVLAAGCAKVRTDATHEADKRYFDAWVSLNYPDAPQIGGVVVISDEEGSGAPVADSAFIFIHYSARLLDGTIEETTREEVARQLGSYDPAVYYGPEPWQTTEDALTVGVERAVKGSSLIEDSPLGSMKVGGRRSFIVPVWLGGKTRYENESDYLTNKSGSSNYIYDVEILDATDDIIRWQLDSMKRFSEKWLGGIDTVSTGFYYKQLREPDDSIASNDTTLYVNYIGRLLNGQVFDTNIADTAKMYNIYSSAKTYAPSEINWNEDPASVTLEGSSVISGWAKALSMMNDHEKGVAMFFSSLGYSYSGSGNSIPPYAPLIFEIELVDNPE